MSSVHPDLDRALQPVLHDMRATGVPLPARIDAGGWSVEPGMATAMVWSRDGNGNGTGIWIDLGWPPHEQIMAATDQLHEWAVEELWGTTATNWPPCRRHPATHPLEVDVRDEEVWWRCPRDGVLVTEVGTL